MYFRLKEYDKEKITLPPISKEELKNSKGLVKPIDNEDKGILLNFYESPSFLVSEELKCVLNKFNSKVIGIPIGFANINTKFLKTYFLLNLRTIDTVERNELILSKDVKRSIFKVKIGLKENVIIRLDVAEAILQSNIIDIQLEEVKMI